MVIHFSKNYYVSVLLLVLFLVCMNAPLIYALSCSNYASSVYTPVHISASIYDDSPDTFSGKSLAKDEWTNVALGDFQIEKGLHLLYELTPQSTIPSIADYIMSINLDNIAKLLDETDISNDFNFYVQLYSDREDLLSIHKISLDEDKLCEVISKRLLIEINLDDIRDNRALITLSLVFIEGYVKCGSEFTPLPEIDGAWIKTENGYVASFNKLSISKNFIILLDNYDVVDGCNEHYGEWIFWTKDDALHQKYVLMLYGLDDLVEVIYPSDSNIHGIAKLLFIDTSQKALNEYKVDDLAFPSTDQIYVKGFKMPALPSERNIYGISRDLAKYIVSNFEKCEDMKKVAELFPIIYDSESKQLILFKDTIPSITSLEEKPWSYVSQVTCYQHDIVLNNTCLKMMEKLRGIMYAGHVYLAFLNDGLEEASFSNNGLLLYIRLHINNGDLYDVLPYIITKGFGITPLSRMAGSVLSINLITITSSRT